MANAIRALAMDAVEQAKCGPSGSADGRGRRRDGAVYALSEIRSGRSRLARPRPLRALGRPRLDAHLRAPSSARLREDDHRRAQALSPVRLADARASRIRTHSGHRDHHRPARPGHRQRGGNGDCRTPPCGCVRRRHCRSHHLCARLRRRPDGRHQPGGHRTRRAPEAEKAHCAVRRQRHLDRWPAGAHRQCRSGQTLRGGRLVGDTHRRPRPGGDRRRDRSGQEVRPAVADRLPHYHRLRRTDQGRQ